MIHFGLREAPSEFSSGSLEEIGFRIEAAMVASRGCVTLLSEIRKAGKQERSGFGLRLRWLLRVDA